MECYCELPIIRISMKLKNKTLSLILMNIFCTHISVQSWMKYLVEATNYTRTHNLVHVPTRQELIPAQEVKYPKQGNGKSLTWTHRGKICNLQKLTPVLRLLLPKTSFAK